ncbi:MAG: flavodoxin [Planctomycetes bacterium]|nr:flavodoxin [Planctomycetota bacterium]
MSQKPFLVIYYSRTGNTKIIAEEIAEQLEADIGRIIDKKDRAGVLGFMGGGKDAGFKKKTDIESPPHDPAAYETVIIGTPVWAWSMCPAVRTWIDQNKDKLPNVAFFLTTGSTGIDRTFRHMTELSQREALATLGLKEKKVKKNNYKQEVRQFTDALKK